MLTRLRKHALIALVFSILPNSLLLAQNGSGGGFASTGLLLGIAVVLIAAVYMVSENLIDIKATQMGLKEPTTSGGSGSMSRLFRKKPPAYVDGPFTDLKKGFDIKLKGAAAPEVVEVESTTYALQPPNFDGISPIPKLTVEVGDEVKAGDQIFFDKKRPDIKYAAPVSGEVVAVNRGAKRSIAEVVLLADKEQQFRTLDAIDLDTISREDLVAFMLDSGAWPMLRQRPYNLVADETVVPENIFISTFDTAPLAPDASVVIAGREDAFAAGIKLLSRLTSGKVYLGLDANGKQAPAEIFRTVPHAEKHWFRGEHPSGNVGVQIHHISPVSASKPVWTLGLQEVITVGKLITERKLDMTRIVAVVGEPLEKPQYVRTKLGAKLSELLAGQKSEEGDRWISGDVLSGKTKNKEGFLNFYDDQLTVIPEGDHLTLFGWLLGGRIKPSTSRTLPGFYMQKNNFKVDTNTNGEERAFVVTGQYEQLLPMDIYPQHLMKAIITQDFEKMEGLGIYELVEEDVALCEFACTSKQPLQHILRSGLDIMREQG